MWSATIWIPAKGQHHHVLVDGDQCDWQVTREGYGVYGCAMDLTKAFDMVEWLTLYQALQNRNVSPLFLRTLLCVYTNQSCNIRMGHCLTLSISPMVKTRVLWAPPFSSPSILMISSRPLGPQVLDADSIVNSMAASAIQSMINKCSDFIKLWKLKFSTDKNPAKSKTKCIIFSRKSGDRAGVAPLKLNGDDLP